MQFRADVAIDLRGRVVDIEDLLLSFDVEELAPFWILYAPQIPCGFGWKAGQLIVCACGNDVVVKAWRHSFYGFSQTLPGVLEKCKPILGGDLHRFMPNAFEVVTPTVNNTYWVWMPPQGNNLSEMGSVACFKVSHDSGRYKGENDLRVSLNRSTKQRKIVQMPFSAFMQKHYAHLTELLAARM